jgi:hypothetical protein
MTLFCDGHEFLAKVCAYTGDRPAGDADSEIPMFEAKANKPFPHDAKWELHTEGNLVEISIRPGDSKKDESTGIYSALFTAPAVG